MLRNTTEVDSGPCYRENCPGPMILVDDIYVCQSCGLGSLPETYLDWLEIDGQFNPDPEDVYEDVAGWDELYNTEGEYVYCPWCVKTYTPLKLHNGVVTCPRCGRTMTDKEFRDYVGSE